MLGLHKIANTRRASQCVVHGATLHLDSSPNTWHARSGGSETKQGKVSGLQEQRRSAVEELRSEGHCLGARMGAMLPWERSLVVLHGCSDLRRSRGFFEALKHGGAEGSG